MILQTCNAVHCRGSQLDEIHPASMLENVLSVKFSDGVFILLDSPPHPAPDSLVDPLVNANKENEFQVLPSSGAVCSLYQVFLVRKTKGSDTGQLYAMKVLKKATLKGEDFTKGPLCLGRAAAVCTLPAICVNTRSVCWCVVSEAVSKGVCQTRYSPTDGKQ